jgi:hypothetical protein
MKTCLKICNDATQKEASINRQQKSKQHIFVNDILHFFYLQVNLIIFIKFL